MIKFLVRLRFIIYRIVIPHCVILIGIGHDQIENRP